LSLLVTAKTHVKVDNILVLIFSSRDSTELDVMEQHINGNSQSCCSFFITCYHYKN